MIRTKNIENEIELLKADINSLNSSYLARSSELTFSLAQVNDSFRYKIEILVKLIQNLINFLFHQFYSFEIF